MRVKIQNTGRIGPGIRSRAASILEPSVDSGLILWLNIVPPSAYHETWENDATKYKGAEGLIFFPRHRLSLSFGLGYKVAILYYIKRERTKANLDAI